MPKGYPRYALAVMVGIVFLNYVDRYVLPSVAIPIEHEFHLSDAGFGALTTAFLLVYAIAALPFGIWGDRGIRRNVIGVGVCIWSVATLFTGLARSFTQLFAARALLGVGEAGYFPAGTSLLGDYFPQQTRGRAMSIWSAGSYLGIAVGFSGGGLIASRLGWRPAFYLTAVPGLILGLLAFRLREPVRGAAEAGGGKAGAIRRVTVADFRSLARIRTLRATIASETILFFVLAGSAAWLPTYLSRSFEIGTGAAGTIAGGILVVGGLIGCLAGGWLADRRIRSAGPRGNLEIGMIGFGAGAVLVVVALSVSSLALFAPALLLGVIALSLYSGPFTAIKQDVVVPTLRASGVTLALLVEHLFGDSYSPFLIGAVSDGLHSIRLALLILLPPALLLAALAAATGLGAARGDAEGMQARWAATAVGALEVSR
ncbi:MAG: MFS transporter [Chloroflexi bacterium]|nr:MAG: MFS transporter [Chloroflexota bacterium]